MENFDKVAKSVNDLTDRIAAQAIISARVILVLSLIATGLVLLTPVFYGILGWKKIAIASACAAVAVLVSIVILKRRSISVDRSKLRGAQPYDKSDADLFSGLGREEEVKNLLSFLASGDIAVIFVLGPWGVGKTSLVRAGLTKYLQDKAYSHVKVAYANARRGSVENIILGQIESPSEPRPQSIKEVIEYQGDRSEVQAIIIDNAEYGEHDQFSAWMEYVFSQSGLYRKVLVFVVEEKYYDENWSLVPWPDPEAIVRIPVKRFSRADARRVAGAIASKARLGLSHELIKEIVDDLANTGSEISPLALSVLLSRAGKMARFRSNDYRDSGDAPGLLKEYILETLEAASKGHSSEIFAALAKQGEGSFTSNNLTNVSLSPADLNSILNQLSTSNTHILRASRDRSNFTILDAWTLSLQAPEENPVKKRVLKKHGFWLDEQPFKGLKILGEGRFLLTRSELRQVQAEASALGSDPGIRAYITRSKWFRSRQLVIATLLLLACIPVPILAYRAWRLNKTGTVMAAWGLPRDLATYGSQLSDLAVTCPVNDLAWLPRSLTTLEVNCESITSLRGVPPKLTHLKLEVSKVSSLDHLPSTVTHLDIHGTRIKRLDGLQGLKLDSLDASGIPVSNLALIPRTVTHLKLYDSNITSLEDLPENLTDLELRGTRVSRLSVLPSTVTRLTLLQGASMVIDSLPPNLEYLETNAILKDVKLPRSLRTLVLNETGAVVPEGIQEVELKNGAFFGLLPNSVTSLRRHGISTHPQDLEGLPPRLRKLKIVWPKSASFNILPKNQLTELDLANSQDIESLKGAVLEGVTDLNISLTKLIDLEDVPNSVIVLRFEFCVAVGLSQYPDHLQELYLGECGGLTKVDNLPETLVILDLARTSVSSLPDLPKSLKELNISNTNIHKLPKLPLGLEKLTLDNEQLKSLAGLPETVKKLVFVPRKEATH